MYLINLPLTVDETKEVPHDIPAILNQNFAGRNNMKISIPIILAVVLLVAASRIKLQFLQLQFGHLANRMFTNLLRQVERSPKSQIVLVVPAPL